MAAGAWLAGMDATAAATGPQHRNKKKTFLDQTWPYLFIRKQTVLGGN